MKKRFAITVLALALTAGSAMTSLQQVLQVQEKA